MIGLICVLRCKYSIDRERAKNMSIMLLYSLIRETFHKLFYVRIRR